MGRIRSIKPSFFKHEELFEAEKTSSLPLRVAFSGLWTVCDRDGRFAWKPRTLKTDILPYDDVDFSAVLDALAAGGFIVRYTVSGREYGCVPGWNEHQVINPREAKSVIPESDASARVNVVAIPARGEGKGREEEGKEDVHVISPDMIARGVLTELGLSGRELVTVLEEVCRSQVKLYDSPGALRDSMVESWRQYDSAKPSLAYTKGAAKFFGDGDWRSASGWPWKEGKQPAVLQPKTLTLIEKMRQQEAM